MLVNTDSPVLFLQLLVAGTPYRQPKCGNGESWGDTRARVGKRSRLWDISVEALGHAAILISDLVKVDPTFNKPALLLQFGIVRTIR